MSDDIWQRAEIESPCIKLCSIHPEARICVGCMRSMNEIRDWSRFTPETRRQLMEEELPGRAARLRKRRGGRAAKVQ